MAAATAKDSLSLAHVEFCNCAEHGLQWDGTLVTRVSDEAQRLGVKPGWKIQSIDNQPVSNGNDVWMRMQEAKWQWRSCHVSFVTNTAVVRAERAAARTAAIQAEEERLAKLAFEGSHDKVHVSQFNEEFEFQGYIDRPEDRAITLEQLHRVMNWSKDKCHRWRDTASFHESNTSGMRLNMDIMNMYHLHHWLVMPATEDKSCAFVELLTNQRQHTTWCVFHWWGELLVDLLHCIECQAATRALPKDAGWWLAAFAIRPHHPPDDILDPTKGRVNRAIVASQHSVMLMLDSRTDEPGPTTAVGRLWCLYELAMLADTPNVNLDVAACFGPKAAFIMRGFNEEEEDKERDANGSGYKAKWDRERNFPLNIIEQTLEVRVQAGQASANADRGRLLNVFAGRDLHLQPVEENENYIRVNHQLRSLFAQTLWRRVMASTANDSHTQRVQLRISEILRGDIWRTHLDISLAYCVPTAPEEKLALMVKSFPPHLKELKLDLKGLDIMDDNMKELAAGLPRELDQLHVDLSFNAQITNFGVTMFVNALPAKLKNLVLGLRQTAVSRDFMDQRDNLEGLRERIIHEAQKGSMCIVTNICPSPDRRVVSQTNRMKL